MIRTPAHKQTDPKKKPGQIIYREKRILDLAEYRRQILNNWYKYFENRDK